MAARVAPTEVRSAHQRVHHFVADAAWPDAAVLGAVRDHVLRAAAKRAGVPEVRIIDDTGFPKQGKHSVGVARQGRSWRGFHHHATLCIAAYGFLLAEFVRFLTGHY